MSFTKPLGIVSSAPITIDITVPYFSFFVLSQSLGNYLSFLSLSLYSTTWSAGTSKPTFRLVHIFVVVVVVVVSDYR